MSNTKRGFGGVGIIIIILLAFGLGAYLLTRNSLNPGYNIKPSTTDNSFKTLPTTTNDISNWKTYKDEKNGLEVKYPANYVFIGGSSSMVTFMDASDVPVTLVGPILGGEYFDDLNLVLATHVLNIFGKTGNPDRIVFVKNNMSLSPELDYLNPDLALKFRANRVESVRSLHSGSYKGYVFQRNAKIYIIYSLEIDIVLAKMAKTFKFQDNSLTTRLAPSPVFSGCEKIIISYNRKDGSSIAQKVTLDGKDYEVNSHIEAEDNWASFSVDGDIGPIGKYYNQLAPKVGNPLTVKDNSNKLPFPDSIVIKGISITLKKVGYTDSSVLRKEFAEACLNKI